MTRRSLTILLVGVLFATMLPAASAGAVDGEVELVAPDGQTAVKKGDHVGVQGSTEADASIDRRLLEALDAAGNVLESYVLPAELVSNEGGTITGSFALGCSLIPGCPDDTDLRASVDAYRLSLDVSSGGDSSTIVSSPLEFDEVRPRITGYFLLAPSLIEVRFSEDVFDPQGDNPRDWRVDGARQVNDVTGEGDVRFLHTLDSFGQDETPSVEFLPERSLSIFPNTPYRDEAGNEIPEAGRFGHAADRIAPDRPTITAIDGSPTSRDGDDQAVPVLGSDPTPTVTVGDMTDGHTARLWLDDGDGTLEDDRDTFVGEATASGGSADVAWPDDLALPDGVHRLFARALDGAACDPDDSSAGACPNASPRSQDALYDLDTIAPTLVDPALASTTAVTVVLSEPVTGPNAAGDWTITNEDGTAGPAVTGVSGSGDSRVLQADGVLPGATLTYAATGDRYADEHGNQLADATIDIVAQEFPVLRLVDAEPVDEQDGPDQILGVPDPFYEEAESVLRVELSDAPRPGETVTVTLEVVGDTATAGVDYTDPGQVTVELSGGDTGADVTVELIGDTLDEFDETFELQVVSVENAVVADGTAVGTILDDDAPVQLSVADAAVTEGGVAEVTVSIDTASGKDVSAQWSLRPGTATPGNDYEDDTGSLTIPAGETSTTVQVTTLQDQLDEADESFELVLGEATNANVADREGTVTITDDDPAPSLRISDFETFEGDEPRTERLIVTLSEVSGRDVRVDWATFDGTATAGDDYTSDSGTLTIPAGATSGHIEFEILGDTDGEPDEHFTVELSGPTNATIDKGIGTVTLLDDDGGPPPPPVITVSVAGGEVGEGDALLPLLFPAELTWTVTLSEPARGPIRVHYRTTDDGMATTGEDFEQSTGVLEIPAGEDSGEITADVIDDDLYEGDETVALQVDDPVGAELVNDAGDPVDQLTTMATIIEDDPAPTVAFADGSDTVVVTEGNDATFTVELDTVSGRDATVDWATVFDGTATTDDLPAQSGTATIPAGDTTATFIVETTDDSEAEDDETVTIELSDPTHATLADDRPTTSQLTLADDEVPIPTITLTPGEGNEDPGLLPPLTTPTPVDFVVELDQAAEDEVTVEYRTTNAGSATAESDFTGTSGTLRIPAGDTSATIEVPVLDDDLDEFDETVQLVLSNPVRARLEGGVAELSGLGTILDDDPLVAVSIADASVDEGEVAEFTVTLDAESGKDIEVAYATDDGTGSATAGDDYTSTSGTVDILAGETEATFTVPTIDDAEVEGNETVEVTIEVTDPDTATVDDGRATLTIVDNETLPPGEDPVVSLTGAVVDEGDPTGPIVLPDTEMTFVVRLSEPADGDVEVSYETAETDPVSATEGALLDDPNTYDYVGTSGTVIIEAGDVSAEITVDVVGDAIDEFDEVFLLRLTGVTGPAQLPPDGLTRTGRIADDDPLAVLGFADGSLDVGVDEGASVELTVERTGATAKPITVDYAISFDGGATMNDAPAQSGTLELAPGESEVSFEIETTQDDLDEPSESFSVVLSNPDNAALDPDADVATVTINDDDLVVPVLSVSGGSVDEGAAGTLGGFGPILITELDPVAPSVVEEHLVFTVTLSEPAEQDVTVDYSTSDGEQAAAGSDYVATSDTLTVPAGETTAEIAVDVLDDDLDEFDEQLEVTFTNPRGVTFSNGASTLRESGTILDDDPVVTADLGDDQTVTEGDPATFEVTLSAVSGKDITLRYRTSDGSATAGQDYRATDDTLTIPAGDTSRTFTIRTLDDAVLEPTEDLSVQLSVVHDDTADLGRSSGTLTITDDDLGVDPNDTVVSLTGDAVEEGDPATPLPLPLGDTNSLDFDVRLSEPADGDVVIDYETRAGTATADDDFEPASGQVTIPDGQEQATVSIGVVPDFLDEFDEDLQLVLTGVSGDAVLPGGQLARTGRILDDDPAAQLRVSDATVLEGDVAELDVTLDNASGKDITVDYAFVDGSATAGDDYQPGSGTLSFPAGTTSRTVQVATLADDDAQELIEQFELVLSNATNAGIDDGRGTISIIDIGADGLPTATAVFLEDTTTREADTDTTVFVPVRLSSERGEDTVVTWSTQQLTATDGEDYRADGGQVTIPAGATSAQIAITIIGDDEVEPNEDFLVLLTQADGAVITGPTGRVTIEDDDGDSGGADDPDGNDPGGDDDPDGAPAGDDGSRELPATGGGVGLGMVALAALLARRRREHG